MYDTYEMYTMYDTQAMYKMCGMYKMNDTIDTRKARTRTAMILLTPQNMGQRGADSKCGLSHPCQDRRARKDTFWNPGTFLEGGSR